MTCSHEVRRVIIDPAAMDDREMLEDMIAAALNDASRRSEALSQEKMSGFTSGLNLPLASSFRFRSVNPSGLEVLIEALRCLPGIGPKSAQRMAYHLLQRDRRGSASGWCA